MRIMGLLSRHATLHPTKPLVPSIRDGALRKVGSKRCFSTQSEDPELKDFMEYLDSLKNYEKLGVPRGSGTDSEDGFDLGRMRRLMERLGNPQSKFKVSFAEAAHIFRLSGNAYHWEDLVRQCQQRH